MKPETAEARFNAKWRLAEDGSGCHLWTGYIMPNGYAVYRPGGHRLAHRWAYEHFIGPIPEGLDLDHVKARGCRHRHCVNVAHLEPVTRQVNLLRSSRVGRANARKTHCPQGHPYDAENTYRPSKNHRVCKTCARDRSRAWARKTRKELHDSRT